MGNQHTKRDLHEASPSFHTWGYLYIMSEAKVPDYDTCGLFHRLHCIKTLASRPVLICKSCYFFARKEAAGILSYSQFRFFVYFTFLFKLDNH